MPKFKFSRRSHVQSSFRSARAVPRLAVLPLLLVTACGDAEYEMSSDGRDASRSELHQAVPVEYTQEELRALAESPAVKALNEPFANPPAPAQTVYVTMRDGVRLSTTLYFPAGLDRVSGKAPTAYNETWYTRSVEAKDVPIQTYLDAGFVVAIVEPRGFGASFGNQTTLLTDEVRADQKEMVDWLATQPWSNGKVAGVGHSVSAAQAEAMAASGTPNLKAAILRASDWDYYGGNMFPGGLFNQGLFAMVEEVMEWQRGEPCAQDLAFCSMIQIAPVDGDSDFSLLQGAMRDHQANIRAATLGTLQFKDDALGSGSIANMSPDASAERLRAARVPARVSASWVDGVTAQGALDRYAALPNVPMEVFIDATGHSSGLAGDPFHEQPFQAASLGAPEQVAADAAFVQRVLSGKKIGRRLNYYVLGANVWKQTQHFPPAGVRSQTLRLSRTHLVSGSPRERGERLYRVDPTTSTGNFNRWTSQRGIPVYYGDRRAAPGARLSFDAAPLERDSELVGTPELCLALRSDQTDGSVFAYLEDVAPDGRVTYLTEGVLRLIHRKTQGSSSSACNPAPGAARTFASVDAQAITPGELMQIELPLLPTAALIRKGHRLRLSLAGADADTFAPIGATATWSVAYGGRRGSSLTLPLRAWSRR